MSGRRPEAIQTKQPLSWGHRAVLVLLVAAVAVPVIASTVTILLLWLVHLWNVPLWILGVVGLVLTAGAASAFWRAISALARRRYQFGLRAVLVAFVVLALLLGILTHGLHEAWRQQRAVWHVAEHGGRVEYYQPVDQRKSRLQRLLGQDPFARVTEIGIRSDRTIPVLLEHREEFADLEYACFYGGVTDAGVKRAGELNGFPKLRLADFVHCRLTDEGMQHLGKWTHVRELFFNGCANVTDAGLPHLEGLPNLHALTLLAEGSGKMPVTDAGLAHVARMSRLSTLQLQTS